MAAQLNSGEWRRNFNVIVQWSKDGSNLNETNLTNMSLTISKAGYEHKGAYTISISINCMRSERITYLEVKGPPDPPLSPMAILAKNGRSTKLSWTAPSFDGNSPIVGYTYFLKSDSTRWKAKNVSSAKRTWKINVDLLNFLELMSSKGRLYFMVQAFNQFGQSKSSQIVEVEGNQVANSATRR
eukprot:m.151153 g.151153  ORF g.151153 m.151153 type:complete len:184 (+) comp38574_c0_seq5:1620-2171(+)